MTGKKTIISCTKYSTKSFSNVLLDSKNLKLYHDLFHYIYGMDAVFAVTCTMLARGYFHGIFQGLWGVQYKMWKNFEQTYLNQFEIISEWLLHFYCKIRD